MSTMSGMRMIWILLVAAASLAAAERDFLPVDEFVHDWRVSKQFTLEVAAKMPEADYAFKPSPAEMSFGTLMLHMTDSAVYRFAQISGTNPPFKLLDGPAKFSKAQILSRMEEGFDYVIAVLSKLTAEQLGRSYRVDWNGRPEAIGRQIALNMFVHVAHHRAQAEVYLRIKGIEPPYYAF